MTKPALEWIDAHCHFMDVSQPTDALKRAQNVGVKGIVSTSTTLATSKQNQLLHHESPFVIHSAIGIHPENVLQETPLVLEESLQWMHDTLERDPDCSIGEIGLDYKYATTLEQQEHQKNFFAKQLALAREYQRPVTIHARQAIAPVLEILEREHISQALLHWFDGTFEQLHWIEQKGFFISIGPAVLNQKKIQRIAAAVSLSHLLLETDSPIPFSGKASEPSWIPQVGEAIGQLRKIPLTTIAQKTTENCQRYFKSFTQTE